MSIEPNFNVFQSASAFNSVQSKFSQNLIPSIQNQNEETLDNIYKTSDAGIWEGQIATYRNDGSAFVEYVRVQLSRNKYSLLLTFQSIDGNDLSPIICVGNINVNNYNKSNFDYNISTTGIKYLLKGYINPVNGKFNLRGGVTGQTSQGIQRTGFTLNIELNYKKLNIPFILPSYTSIPLNFGDFSSTFINDLQEKITSQGMILLRDFINNKDEGLLLEYLNIADLQLLYHYIYNYPLLIGQLTFTAPPILTPEGDNLLLPAFVQFGDGPVIEGTPLDNEPYQPVNQIYYLSQPITPDFNRIVSPNFDAIYSSTYINLGVVESVSEIGNSVTMKGNNVVYFKVPSIPTFPDLPSASNLPLILDRYFAVQVIDEYSQTLCTLSKSTTNEDTVANLKKLSYNYKTSLPTHDMKIVIVNENWNDLTASEKFATDPNYKNWDNFSWNNPINFNITTRSGPSKLNEIDNGDGTYTFYTKVTIPSNYCWLLFRVGITDSSYDLPFDTVLSEVFKKQVLTTFSNNNKNYVDNNPSEPIKISSETADAFKNIWDNVSPNISPGNALLEGVNNLRTYLNLSQLPVRNGAISTRFSTKYQQWLSNNSFSINPNGTFSENVKDFAESDTDEYYRFLGENTISKILNKDKTLSVASLLELGNILFNQNTQFISLGESIGTVSDDYITRTIVADNGFGANPLFEASYFGTGVKFNTANNYSQIFNSSNIPSVKTSKGGFWSISVYNSSNEAIDNPFNIYSLDSFTISLNAKYPDNILINYKKVNPLVDTLFTNDVISKTTIINFPLGDAVNPADPVDFQFILRLYLPDDSIIDNEYNFVASIPGIRVVNN